MRPRFTSMHFHEAYISYQHNEKGPVSVPGSTVIVTVYVSPAFSTAAFTCGRHHSTWSSTWTNNLSPSFGRCLMPMSAHGGVMRSIEGFHFLELISPCILCPSHQGHHDWCPCMHVSLITFWLLAGAQMCTYTCGLGRTPMHTHKHRQTDRQTDRQTHTHTHTQRERERERERERGRLAC
jgi:hypothetical protein